MDAAIRFDSDEIGRICAEHGVSRLRLFGSALSDRFDPVTSDIDFVVDLFPGRQDMFSDYFGLLEDLTELMGREVDLVIGRSIKNPYFRKSVMASARDVYAA